MEKNEMEFDEELYGKFFAVVGSPDEGARPDGTRRISQAKAALALGYSSSVVSAYKSRSYNGNVKAFEEAARSWLKREERRIAKIEVPIVATNALDSIRNGINITQDERDIAVIVGGSGTGKTTALRAIAGENPSAILLEADSSFTKNVLVTEIARAVGVEPKGSVTTIIGRIVEALRGRDTVIMIDEADYLSDASLELVRRVIHDKAQTGVVLVGLPRLKYQLENRRNDHEQLTSRVGVMLEVKGLARQDAVKIIEGVWQGLPGETVDAFFTAAKGSARTLVKLMGRVHQTMAINGIDTPNAEVIEAAGAMLMR
ncbi:MAG: AAA family ATPase [Treponema sp.]|jgi:DNA transposition AAA+ family ATPase|nr:AAA family ATPase [Treponema sp.]